MGSLQPWVRSNSSIWEDWEDHAHRGRDVKGKFLSGSEVYDKTINTGVF